MRSPTALLTIDEDIRQAELLVQDRQLRVAHRATQALTLLREERARWRERVHGLIKPAALATAASGAALFLLARRRPAAPAAATRPSARTAAFIAPLVTRLLAPSLGRDAATLLSTIVLPFAFGGRAPPRTAPLVRWPRYLGHWFELAHSGQRHDALRDASLTYLPDAASATAHPRRLRVVARHLGADGQVILREGIGRVQADRGAARMRVTFARGLARWLPGAWADIWVLDVAPNYSAALMGTPDRKRLWLLGRTPEIDGEVLERMITRAAAQGYDINRLVPVDHTPSRAPGRMARRVTARRPVTGALRRQR
jgi:apolipoprotein D and lipocalin family protein